MIKDKDGGLSTIGLLITIFTILALVLSLIAGAIYISKKPVVVGEEVQSLAITAVSPVTAGQPSQITVQAFDKNGNPVSGADISLSYSLSDGRESWNVALQLTDQGDGSYTSSLTMEWANTYVVNALVEGTSVRSSTEVKVMPGEVADVVIASTPPKPASPWYTSTLTFYFIDQYGNIVPADLVNPVVEPTFGYAGQTSPLQAHPDDTFTVSINAADWGTSNVSITDSNTGVSASEEIEFTPVYVDLTYDLVKPITEISSWENLEFTSSGGDQTISLDIGVFFPPGLGTLGQYDLRVEYDTSSLNLAGVVDPNPDDGFAAPEWWTSENVITLTASGSTAEPGVSVATLLFEPLQGIKEKAENIVVWAENLWGASMESIEPPAGTVAQSGKVFEKLFVPLKIWIVDNVRDEKEIREIAELTENIYNMNAKACRFKYWFVFLVEINHISENEWKTKVPTGHIEGDDPNDPWYPEPNADNQRRNLVNQNKWERWVNVYWLPDNAFGEYGWYEDNVIFIDNANEGKDNHITLAHELAHFLSGGKVEDPTTTAGRNQGADNYCNLMAYDLNKSHENLYPEQTKLIENWIDEHSEERPESEGGGRILKPVPY